MEGELIKSVVCICHENGIPEGTGILISSKHIVTCAHVVTGIIGQASDDQNSIGRELNVILFISDKPIPVKVKVASLFPQDNIDFAGLEILTKLPGSVPLLKFVGDNLLSGHKFRAYGFPNFYNNGVWAYGEVRGKQTDGLIQLESNKSSAYFIKSGFSGGPVWDDNLKGWIGIINKADTAPEANGATMVSALVLRQCWPQVVDLTATPEPQYLSQLIEDLKCFAGIVAYVPSTITVSIRTGKPQPYVKQGVKWSNEFDNVVSNARINDGYLTTVTKTGIEEVVSAHSRFILLGELGAGKTTSLQHAAIQLAQERLKSGTGLIPLLVDLSDEWIKPDIDDKNNSYSTGLKNLLEKNWNLETQLDEMLVNGQVMVFLDGLNEMGVDRAQKAIAIRSWLEGQRRPRYTIVACRDSAYTSELDLGLPTASIGKLEVELWELIATRLIQHINEAQTNQLQVTEFVDTIRAQGELSRILDRPYFVERLVQIYASGGQIPNTEALILNDFANIVWKRERLQQPNLPEFSVMQTLLGHLAFLLLSRQEFSIEYNEIVKEAVGFLGLLFKRDEVTILNIVLKASVQADLLRHEGNRYRFSDEFFRNYFAAINMMDNPAKAIPLPNINTGDLPETWEESVKYFHQLLPVEETKLLELIKKVVSRNPVIAADSIMDTESRSKHCDFVISQLLDLLKTECSPSLEKGLLIAFSRIGFHSYPQIIQVLADEKADFQQRTMAAWLSGELRLRESVPILQAIIQSETSLKERKARLDEELKKQRLITAGLMAVQFGLAIISGRPATLGTAFDVVKDTGSRINPTAAAVRQQTLISDVEKEMKFVGKAKTALRLLLST